MKNLYRKMGFTDNNIDDSAIRYRLGLLGSEDKFAVEEILFNPSRRGAYDRTYNTLEQIGTLRAMLKQGIADNYWGKEYAGFNISISETETKKPTNEPVKQKEVSDKNVGKAVALVFLVLLGLLFIGISVNSENEPVKNQKPIVVQPPTAESTLNTQLEEKDSHIKSDQFPIEEKPVELTPAEILQAEIDIFKETHQELSLPPTGILSESNQISLAPFEVITQGLGDHYFIKLEEVISEKVVLTAFIRVGERFERDVPLGSMILKYATGTSWYGVDELFGPETDYYKADDIMVFSQNSNYYEGFTIELYKQVGGNLEVDEIDSSFF